MKYVLYLFTTLLICILVLLIVTNIIMYTNSRSAPPTTQKEFAIVLGASVHGHKLSTALRTRMEIAIKLYNAHLVSSIILSGDGTDANYSETHAMKKYALKRRIPEEDLITDDKGYNTYATMLRAKEVFGAESAYIISQKFHLIRAVWIARELGIDADGVNAGEIQEHFYYDLREFFARSKDFFQVELKAYPLR